MLEFSNGASKWGQTVSPWQNRMATGRVPASIVAFAEKHSAAYAFRMEDGWFKLQLTL